MKEGSNNSDKIACLRDTFTHIIQVIQGTVCNILTHYQQLPIKDKLFRLSMQPCRLAAAGHHVHGKTGTDQTVF
jgi:hypothetical protein